MNTNLIQAKKARNDEFYTLYEDIEREIAAYVEYDPDVFRSKTVLLPCDDPDKSNFTRYFMDNFDRLGLHKLISTCIAPQARFKSPLFDGIGHGRFLIRTGGDGTATGLLGGDGDFRSTDVCRLRDEADIIITNPPFSLFREFIKWIIEAQKKFLIIGNKICVTYKEVFPLIKENKLRSGVTPWAGGMRFVTSDENDVDKVIDGVNMKNVSSIWFTNLEHGRRHEPLQLMTMSENKKYSRHKDVKGHDYQHYDNYDAIDVPFTDAIPSDYDGVMGVPISFLDKYCPEQFEIVGNEETLGISKGRGYVDGKRMYARIFIRKKAHGI